MLFSLMRDISCDGNVAMIDISLLIIYVVMVILAIIYIFVSLALCYFFSNIGDKDDSY